MYEEEGTFLGVAVPGVVADRAAVGDEGHEPGYILVVAVDDIKVAVVELGNSIEVGPDRRIDDRPLLASADKGDGLNDMRSTVDDYISGVDLG